MSEMIQAAARAMAEAEGWQWGSVDREIWTRRAQVALDAVSRTKMGQMQTRIEREGAEIKARIERGVRPAGERFSL